MSLKRNGGIKTGNRRRTENSTSEIVLNFPKDDLFASPTMFKNAVEPGMLFGRHFRGGTPKLFDEFIGQHVWL